MRFPWGDGVVMRSVSFAAGGLAIVQCRCLKSTCPALYRPVAPRRQGTAQGRGMPTDKVIEALLEALKQGLARPGEHRLYRSGKLDGLFPGRGGAGAEAAARALREGLIETVRTETKGKTAIDWVRLTPRAVDFVHEHE